MEPYDLIVIGGGPAGYLAAQRAAEKKKRVLLFEKNKLGGVCLNEGCIPTKTLLNSAKIYEHAKNGNSFGILTENASIDPTAIQKRKNRVIHMLVGGVKMTMKKQTILFLMLAIMFGATSAQGQRTRSISGLVKNFLQTKI